MKINKIFLKMILIALVATIGFVAAEDATIGPYTFTIPDGYTIATQTDDTIAMQLDANNALSFATGISDDIESSKQTLISQGQELISEEEIDFNNMHFNIQAFKTDKDGTTLYSYNYICLSDDGNFVLTVVTDNADFDSDLNAEDNVAGTLLGSLSTS